MSGRLAGAVAVAVALAAMAAALALPVGRQPAGPGSAPGGGSATLAVELYSGYTPYGQRMLIGTVPAIADRLELTNAGVTTIVPLTDEGTLDDERRHLQIPLPGVGPWQATALWAEHRLGTDDGPPELLPGDHSV